MPQREKQSFATNRSPSYLANLPVRSLTFVCSCFRVVGLPTVPEQGFFDTLTERNSDHTLPCIQSAVGIGNSKPCRVLTLSGSYFFSNFMKSDKEIFWATLKSFGFTKKRRDIQKILLARLAREKISLRKFSWKLYGSKNTKENSFGRACVGFSTGLY